MQKRLTQVETSLNHQLRMEKEAMLKLTQAHDEATAELDVKHKEIQEVSVRESSYSHLQLALQSSLSLSRGLELDVVH